jgi:hypothetical protein
MTFYSISQNGWWRSLSFLAVEKGAPVSTKKEWQKRRKMVFSFGICLGLENKKIEKGTHVSVSVSVSTHG